MEQGEINIILHLVFQNHQKKKKKREQRVR